MKLSTGALRLVLVIVILGAIGWALLNRTMFDADAIDAWLTSWGWWSPLIFIGLWAIWALLFLPGAILGIAGGVFFGPVWGSILTLTGATLGAVLAFLASRYVASDWVTQKAGRRLKQLLDGVESEGWRFVAFTRLVPLFPFNLLNYALGLTHIRLSSYAVTTFICMAPGTVAYAYLGYAGREAIAGGEDLISKGLMALGLLVAVAFLPRLVRHVRRPPQIWIEVDALKNVFKKVMK